VGFITNTCDARRDPIGRVTGRHRPGFIFGVQRDASVADAARTMTTNNVGIVAVFAGDRVVGVSSSATSSAASSIGP
jgi:hypothetical protein